MDRELLIKHMVADVMRNFDFARVRRAMVAVGWKWALNGVRKTPTALLLMKEAKRLLTEAASHYGETYFVCGSGGFMAIIDGPTLTLQFVLAEWLSDARDYIQTNED